MEVLRVKNTGAVERALAQTLEEETLDDLDEDDVFRRCLEANRVPDDQHAELFAAYREAVLSLREEQGGHHED
jgi:exonuclease SbcD